MFEIESAAYKKLEKALIAAGVPRIFWPRFFESERRYQLRKRYRREEREETQRRLARDLQNDANERRRASAFSMFCILMLWLISSEQQRRASIENAITSSPSIAGAECADFVERSTLCLATTEHARWAGSQAIQRGTMCAALASGWTEAETRFALQYAMPSPMTYALHLLDREAADAEQQKKADSITDTPEPTPPAPVDPQADEADEEERQRQQEELLALAAPTW